MFSSFGQPRLYLTTMLTSFFGTTSLERTLRVNFRLGVGTLTRQGPQSLHAVLALLTHIVRKMVILYSEGLRKLNCDVRFFSLKYEIGSTLFQERTHLWRPGQPPAIRRRVA